MDNKYFSLNASDKAVETTMQWVVKVLYNSLKEELALLLKEGLVHLREAFT